jgi:hypothetical protein
VGILGINKKRCFLDALEQFHIYANTKQNICLNNIYRDMDNSIFYVVIAHTPHISTDSTLECHIASDPCIYQDTAIASYT